VAPVDVLERTRLLAFLKSGEKRQAKRPRLAPGVSAVVNDGLLDGSTEVLPGACRQLSDRNSVMLSKTKACRASCGTASGADALR